MIHARKAKFGSVKVASELREKGVADELVAQAVKKIKETEFDSVLEIHRKKYKTSPQNREEWAKQARFLQSRGFGFDLIKKVLTKVTHEEIND